MSVLTRSSTGVDPRLLRSYRRLLKVYPRGPRRAELLDTLVESAPPGRRRPTPREIVDLVWHGSRARLGRPKSRGIVVLAFFVALAGGFLGAGAANGIGWRAVEPLPSGAEAAEISETVFPGLTVWGGGDAARIVHQADGDGIEYGYAISWVKHTPATREVATYTAAVRARLEAAGWTVAGVDPPLSETEPLSAYTGDRSMSFTVTRGALGLRFSDYYWAGRPAYDGDGNATYFLWRQPPSWLETVTWLGFLPGAFLAWLLTGWTSRRLEPDPAMSTPAVIGAVLAVLCVVPASLLALASGGVADETAAPSWQGLAFALRTPAILFGVLAALLLFVAAAQRPPRPPRRLRQALLSVMRRRRPLSIAVSLLVGWGAYNVVTHDVIPGSCTPSVPAGIVDSPSARMSEQARVFISPQANGVQRDLAQAAIGRAFGSSASFAEGPQAPGFLTPYCSRGRVESGVAETLPRHWTVELPSPGLFGGLAAELIVMPGVVAVQHVPIGL